MTSLISDWTIGRRAGELPEGWTETALEEIVVHALGGEWGEEPERADTDAGLVRVSVVRGTEFRDWKRGKGKDAALRAIKKDSLEKRRLAPGDLVVEISGGGAGQPVGRTLLIDEAALSSAAHPLVCSNFCRQVRLHRGVSPAYVHLVLTHQYLCGKLDEHQTQTTNIRNLNFQSFLSGVILPLPPLPEQERIVAKVEELMVPVDRVRARLGQIRRILRRFPQSVLGSAYAGRMTEEWRETCPPGEPFGDLLARAFAERREEFRQQCLDAEAFDERAPRRPKNLTPSEWEAPEPLEAPKVPEGWSLFALQDLIRRSQYGTSVKADGSAKTGVPILRMGNIRDGRIDLASLKYMDPAKEDVAAYTVRRGDILFNRTNSPELVGKAAVYDLDRPAVFASYLVRVECDERLVDSRYVCGWINSPWGRFWARTVRTDCVSQSNINASKLLSLPVPVPPLAEQREIVRRIEEHLALATEVEARIAKVTDLVEKLTRTILTRALRGELVPPEAEAARSEGRGFEPAADLLDRIRAERLSPSPEPKAGSGPALRSGRGPAAVSEPILAAIRQSCWGAGKITRDKLIEQVADRLECPTIGKSVRARIEKHLKVAAARRIVVQEGDLLSGATPTFGRYDFDFLIRMAKSLMEPGVEYDRAEVVRAVAAALGYSQMTLAIRERMDRVFEWAAQQGDLWVSGETIGWAPTP
jgi:type I restriction enzyme, S subunit